MDILLDNFEVIYNTVFFDRKNYSDIEFEKCRNGNFTFKINSNEKSVYIHSKYNPEKEAEKFVESLDFEKNTIFIIFGFGLGYSIRELLNKKSKRNFYIIYEPNSALFSKIADEGYCNDILEDEHVFVLSKSDINYFELFLNESIESTLCSRCKTIIIPNYKKVYEKKYNEFLKITKKILSNNIITRNTLVANMKLWSENNFNNTENILNSYSLSQMMNIFKDKTVIIVSAGPSLKKNINLLKEIKGKVPIMSVFVAAKVLLENDIIPDFIVSVDAKQTGMKQKVYDDIALIYDPRVPKEFIDNHNGINIFISSVENNYPTAIMKKHNKKIYICESGGSVACDCVSISQIMGFKNIILIGQDLAFTDNKRHIDGTEHKGENDIKEFDEDFFEVPAIGGGTVFTNSVFIYYINWFEKFALLNKENVNLIDATEGGALIKNTEVLTLREAIDKYCEISDVNNIIENITKKDFPFSDDEKEDILNTINNDFNKINDLLKIIQEEEEILDKYIKSLEISDIKEIIKFEKMLDNIDEKIKKEKQKIIIITGILDYIEKAVLNMAEIKKQEIDDENKFIASAIIRKKQLINLKNSLEFVKKLNKK